MGGKKAPTPPNPMLYFPTQSAQPDASYYQSLIPVPKTPTALVGDMMGAEGALPEEFQLTSNNQILSPEARSRYEQVYSNEYLAPRLAKLQIEQRARGDSTFGGAAYGQGIAEGANQALFAGEDLYNQRLNQLLQKRSSLFGNTGQMAQTQDAANVARGEMLAKLAQNQQQQDNAFALSRYNAFQAPQWQAYEADLANKKSNTQGKLGLLGTGMQLAGMAGGAFFGGPGGAALGSAAGSALGGMFGGGRNAGGGVGQASGTSLLQENSPYPYFGQLPRSNPWLLDEAS